MQLRGELAVETVPLRHRCRALGPLSIERRQLLLEPSNLLVGDASVVPEALNRLGDALMRVAKLNGRGVADPLWRPRHLNMRRLLGDALVKGCERLRVALEAGRHRLVLLLQRRHHRLVPLLLRVHDDLPADRCAAHALEHARVGGGGDVEHLVDLSLVVLDVVFGAAIGAILKLGGHLRVRIALRNERHLRVAVSLSLACVNALAALTQRLRRLFKKSLGLVAAGAHAVMGRLDDRLDDIVLAHHLRLLLPHRRGRLCSVALHLSQAASNPLRFGVDGGDGDGDL